MADKDWRGDILKELEEQDVIAVESIGILTGNDIRSAMNAIKESEAARDEDTELKHIRDLQRERAARMYGAF